MTAVCILTPQGNKKFEQYIISLRQGETEPFQLQELNHHPWSSVFEPAVEVEQKTFTTRMQMGQYLTDRFSKAGVKVEDLVNNKNLWSWLAAYWFNVLCPPGKDGSHKVRETIRYVCSLDFRDYFRHYVGATWFVYSQHGKYSRLFLHSPPHEHNDFMEQLATTQSIISSKSLVEVADKLYWDNHANHPKTNASNRNVLGNVRRLVAVIGQLELTFDVYSMSANKILGLLPAEFKQWIV